MAIIKATLKREKENKYGTHSRLYVTDEEICFFLELPWRKNKRDISCIPADTYRMTRENSPTFGDCFTINEVPDRDLIRVHIGNTIKDTKGCPLPGLERMIIETVDGQEPRNVRHSEMALNLLKDKFGFNPVELTIVETEVWG